MGMLLYPGNNCSESGGPVTVECSATSYREVLVTFTNVGSNHNAWWTQSSNPSVKNYIALTEGTSEFTLVVDTNDTYQFCIDSCGTCGVQCCEYQCINLDGGLVNCECLEDETVRTKEAASLTIDGFGGTATIPTPCSIGCGTDINATYIVNCGTHKQWRWYVFLCSTVISGTLRDLYLEIYLDINVGAGVTISPGDSSIILRIRCEVHRFTSGGTPIPLDNVDFSAGSGRGPNYVSIHRAYWSFIKEWANDDATITDCIGDELTLPHSACTYTIYTSGTTTINSGGCTVPTTVDFDEWIFE